MTTAAKALEQASALYEAMPTIRKFVSEPQIQALAEAANGEEREYFINLMIDLAEHLNTMPKTYKQDGKGDDAIVGLHYFRGDMDWYITERDMEDEQLQAFGLADLGYGAELGYISILELIENGIELDLHWTSKTLAEVKAS